MEHFEDEREANKALPAICLLKSTVPVKKRKICIHEYSFPKRQCRREEDLDLLWKFVYSPLFLSHSEVQGEQKKKERKIIPSEFKLAQTILTQHITSSLAGFD